MSNPEVLRCNHNSYTGLVCRHLYTSFSKLLKSKPSSFLLDLTNYPDHSRCLLKSRSHADHLRLVSRCRPAKGWWRMTGSNRRPPACKAGALPAELIPPEPLVGLVGFEPTTPALSRRCSNQLSYRPALCETYSNNR